jgi:hypothetical protein
VFEKLELRLYKIYSDVCAYIYIYRERERESESVLFVNMGCG